jgi:hypothetical protein
MPAAYDNEHAAARRTAKAYRLSRPALATARLMREDFSHEEVLSTLASAPRELRERVRLMTGQSEPTRVRPPSDGSEGVSDETWAQVVSIVNRDLDA